MSRDDQEDELRKAREEAGYKILSSRMAYKNPWTAVREDIIIHPSGKQGLYGVVERGTFAVIMPFHANGNVTLVQQFRYPVGKRLWEFPMGMWETREGVQAEDLALGELREETGLRARELIHAGELYQGAGYSTQKGHVFLARDLVRGEADREATESDMIVRDLPLTEFEDMIRKGELTCMVTIAAFAQIRLRGLI
ncbi:NUDIX hydrolase [Acetobacteraceae bacterium ESL0709]|nr:NUDIX hydrolase [Acetobacteraceae bacterium ESL0697]MDF7678812.1 NUDIX hydrolase [Acetobacteraceae bacterium ESL0709]